jgi:hypothetical protein
MTTNWLGRFLLNLGSWSSCLNCAFCCYILYSFVIYNYVVVNWLVILCLRNLANNELEGSIPQNISSCTALNQLYDILLVMTYDIHFWPCDLMHVIFLCI